MSLILGFSGTVLAQETEGQCYLEDQAGGSEETPELGHEGRGRVCKELGCRGQAGLGEIKAF